MKDRKMPFLGIGAASIVLVLAMVCLAVFAANEQVGAIDERLWKLYRRSKDRIPPARL